MRENFRLFGDGERMSWLVLSLVNRQVTVKSSGLKSVADLSLSRIRGTDVTISPAP